MNNPQLKPCKKCGEEFPTVTIRMIRRQVKLVTVDCGCKGPGVVFRDDVIVSEAYRLWNEMNDE